VKPINTYTVYQNSDVTLYKQVVRMVTTVV